MRAALAAAVLLATSAAATGAPADATAFPKKYAPETSVYRGAIVYNHYCVLCHGVTARGNGRAARLYDPRPADLVKSDKNAQYRELIIRRGGAALGRSEFMPPWGDELSDEQVADVVAFLGSIQERKRR